MIPLTLMNAGSKSIVNSIRGNDSVRKKIIDLGIVPGAEIEIVSAAPGSPVIVGILENRIIIDHSTSKRIMVQP